MYTLKKISTLAITSLASFLISARMVAAATSSAGTGTANGALENPLNIGNCGAGVSNGSCLSAFLADILQFVVQIGTIVVILMLVYIGFKFVTARGAPGRIEQARDMLLWTVVGALILLGAQAIAIGIEATVHAIGG